MGFTLLPPDPVIINPDLQLEAALVPPFDLQPPTVQPYGRGWAFDFIQNEFIFHGGAVAEVYDTDNLQVWIEKALRTAKATYEIYGDDYGMTDPFAMIGQPVEPALIGDYEQQVTDALLVHDRIVAVEDFAYTPFDDQLYITFTVVLDGNPAETITANTTIQLASS